jgi:hypothetical protein
LARRAEKVDGEVPLNKFLAGGERGEKGLGSNAYSRVHCIPIPNYNVGDIGLPRLKNYREGDLVVCLPGHRL